MSIFKLELVTPNSYLVFNDVKSISGKSTFGEFEALAGHESFMINLMPCTIKVCFEDGMTTKKFAVSSGVIRISDPFYCIMAEEIIELEKVDVKTDKKVRVN